MYLFLLVNSIGYCFRAMVMSFHLPPTFKIYPVVTIWRDETKFRRASHAVLPHI